MAEKLSIKVDIVGRIFPLKVHAEEEENIRKAASIINKKVQSYIEQYGIKDKQVALSMCALELASDFLTAGKEKSLSEERMESKLQSIENLLSEL
jgi:cell division protein ZapA